MSGTPGVPCWRRKDGPAEHVQHRGAEQQADEDFPKTDGWRTRLASAPAILADAITSASSRTT